MKEIKIIIEIGENLGRAIEHIMIYSVSEDQTNNLMALDIDFTKIVESMKEKNE